MPARASHHHLAMLRGATRLALEATQGVTDLVEAMHATIGQVPAPLGAVSSTRTTGITGLVYRSVRGVTRLVGGGLEASLAALGPLLGQSTSSPRREALIAVLNGVLGDYLADTANPLAITMQFRHQGAGLPLAAAELARSLGEPGPRLLVLVHGLCMSDLQWRRQGHDHGAALAADLGFTPVYLHYNSGLHVSTNGQRLARELEALVREWPVPLAELVLLGHSMGGLVARSAHHYASQAGMRWTRRLRRQVFLGTPHLGAPLERGGHWIEQLLGVSPYTAPLARLGQIRSAGITDLRHGSLLDDDWQDLKHHEPVPRHPVPVPLPAGVASFAIAATQGQSVGDLGDRLLGDGLVPLSSALGRHRNPARQLNFPTDRQWVAHDTGHLELLNAPEVYAKLREILAAKLD